MAIVLPGFFLDFFVLFLIMALRVIKVARGLLFSLAVVEPEHNVKSFSGSVSHQTNFITLTLCTATFSVFARYNNVLLPSVDEIEGSN